MPGTLASTFRAIAAKRAGLGADEAAECAVGGVGSPERRRRILYVSHVATPGGGELSLIDLLEVLDTRRFSPRVVVPHSGELSVRLERLEIPSDHCPSLTRLYRTRSPHSLLRQLNSVLVGASQLRRLIRREQPDLIHANSTISALYALLALWRCRPAVVRPPVVWHSRDMAQDRVVERWVAKRAACIVATSNAARTRLARITDPGKIELIPNGIRLREPRSPPALPSQLGLPDSEGPLLVSVGQWVPWKAFDVAIAAVAIVREEHPQVQLLLIGEDRYGDNPEMEGRLRRRIACDGLTGSVHLLGQRRDVRDILACADLLVHPAYPEPFGRVIVEAMAEGCPVVAFDGDHGPAEILRHDQDGILATPRTAEALAASITSLLHDPDRRRKMATAGRRRVQAQYDRSLMALRIENLYDRLLGSQPRFAESTE